MASAFPMAGRLSRLSSFRFSRRDGSARRDYQMHPVRRRQDQSREGGDVYSALSDEWLYWRQRKIMVAALCVVNLLLSVGATVYAVRIVHLQSTSGDEVQPVEGQGEQGGGGGGGGNSWLTCVPCRGRVLLLQRSWQRMRVTEEDGVQRTRCCRRIDNRMCDDIQRQQKDGVKSCAPYDTRHAVQNITKDGFRVTIRGDYVIYGTVRFKCPQTFFVSVKIANNRLTNGEEILARDERRCQSPGGDSVSRVVVTANLTAGDIIRWNVTPYTDAVDFKLHRIG